MSVESNIEQGEVAEVTIDQVIDLLMSLMSDGLDHPEVWDEIPVFLESFPSLPDYLTHCLAIHPDGLAHACLLLIQGIAWATQGEFDRAFESIEGLAIRNSQSALVQGALFRLKALREPENPNYQLAGRFCTIPFRQMDVLENSTHLCCASYLNASAGNLKSDGWREVWNSATAQDIRASIHDGSYRYCNKSACPWIAGHGLPSKEEVKKEAVKWERIIDSEAVALEEGPETVNLAYDRTCNLSCPSCRVEKYAADNATRARYDEMQRTKILPLLKDARTVFITGSGDPFASKNFRRLMKELTPEDYPELGFQIMTNGMLLTPKQWDEFPTLHGRTRVLKLSIDAATGPTHEKLRRGAIWPTVMENMKFAGQLSALGDIDCYELVFTVQHDNYREMGDAVDLAKEVGAQRIFFARLTNWGTFTASQFKQNAVFMPSHAEYDEFIEKMQDERLLDPMVNLGDLKEFVRRPLEAVQ